MSRSIRQKPHYIDPELDELEEAPLRPATPGAVSTAHLCYSNVAVIAPGGPRRSLTEAWAAGDAHRAAVQRKPQTDPAVAATWEDYIFGAHLGIAPPADPPAAVQRKDNGTTPTDADVPAIAASGIEGSGQPLPHLDRIQAAFGSHDVSHVRAHIGGQAADAADAIGAEAYATGTDVAFLSAPDLHTAAHEAAHVIQQQQGVHLKGGVGQAGDTYEQHADAVADKVVRGESAQPLLAGLTNEGGGEIQVQRKEPRSGDATVSASGSKHDFGGLIQEPFCTRRDAEGDCFLSDAQRTNLIMRLATRLMGAHTNFALAVTESKIKNQLKPKPSMLDLLIDILYATGNVAIGQLTQSVRTLKRTFAGGLRRTSSGFESVPSQEMVIARFDKEASTLGVILTSVSGKARGAAHAAAEQVHDQSSLQAWLDTLSDRSMEQKDAVLREAEGSLDDMQLLVLTAYYEPANHRRRRYENELQDLVDKYRSNVEQLGPISGAVGGFGTGEQLSAVRIIGPHGDKQSRLALCRVPAMARGDVDVFCWFVRWVDRGFSEVAHARQEELSAGEITARWDRVHDDGHEINQWVAESVQFVPQRYDPSTGKTTGGGTDWKSYD